MLIVLLTTGLAWSGTGVPQLMNYQGRLTNSSGSPLDTTVSMIFTIYDDSTGGNAKWTETHPSVTVTDGLFNVLLGSVSTIIDDTVFNSDTRYLGIKVGSNAEISPRSRLVSAPYAFKALNADTAAVALSGPVGQGGWSDDGAVVRLTTGTDDVGIGTATPSEKLDVDGNIHASGTIASGNSITIDGTSDMITASGGSLDFDDENLSTDGDVEIGSDSPVSTSVKLNIKGTTDSLNPLIRLHHQTSMPSQLANPSFEIYSPTYDYTPFTILGGGIILQYSNSKSGSFDKKAGTEVNRISPDPGDVSFFNAGNVGFGTDAPESRIHIKGYNDDLTPLLKITHQAAAPAELLNPVFEIENEAYGYNPITINGAGAIQLATDGGELTTMIGPGTVSYFKNANVGFGTNAPEAKLHIYGETDDITPLIKITHHTVTPDQVLNNVFQIRNDSYGYSPFSINGGGAILLTNDGVETTTQISPGGDSFFSRGNVGFGTNAPQRQVHITDVMRLEPRHTPPSDAAPGDMYIDGSDGNRLKVFDGTDWQSCW